MESKKEYIRNEMNRLGKSRTPFLFLLDFEMLEPFIVPLNQANPKEILFDLNGIKNFEPQNTSNKKLEFRIEPISKTKYCRAFEKVQKELRYGNSFLLNLTFPSKITTNYSLKEFFHAAQARYKIWFKDCFVTFSPEIFVQIQNGIIRSFPMKGTLDARLPDAHKKLIESKKEKAEHFTIVDLIRNDLSAVAENIRVKKFQYIDHIQTHKNEILQMSSEIEGTLPRDFNEQLGDIFLNLLPAGSISGAPKKKTLEIILNTETDRRGFYTGIVGIFDGNDVDSGILIRYLEKTEKGMIFRSGGGITALSQCEEEYNELIQKIYVPFTGKPLL